MPNHIVLIGPGDLIELHEAELDLADGVMRHVFNLYLKQGYLTIEEQANIPPPALN